MAMHERLIVSESEPSKTPSGQSPESAQPPAPIPVADQFEKLTTSFGDAAADKGIIPLAPDLEADAPKPTSPSLLTSKEDACPNCNAPLAADAVVCMKCGYDQKQGRVVKPEVGVVEVEDKKAVPEYVTIGRGSPRPLAIAGGVLLVAAMITAAVYSPVKSVPVIAAIIGLIFFQAALYTGSGVVAVWAAARLAGQRFTHIDLVAARMFVAVALFQLVSHFVLIPDYRTLSQIVMFVLAAGTYWLTIFFFFRKDHRETSVLLAFHVAAGAFVHFGVMISAFLQSVVSNR